jgi:hypothetical protein
MKAADLLDRFVDMYGEVPMSSSMVEGDPNLWYDYYKYSGQHMILTDEGWEPGESLESYMEGLDEGQSIHDLVLLEVNWHKGDMKYPRIFPRKTKPVLDPIVPSKEDGSESEAPSRL